VISATDLAITWHHLYLRSHGWQEAFPSLSNPDPRDGGKTGLPGWPPGLCKQARRSADAGAESGTRTGLGRCERLQPRFSRVPLGSVKRVLTCREAPGAIAEV